MTADNTKLHPDTAKLISAWVKHMKLHGKSASTMKTYKRVLIKYIWEATGNKPIPIHEIPKAAFEDWWMAQIDTLQQNTRRIRLAALKSFYEFAAQNDIRVDGFVLEYKTPPLILKNIDVMTPTELQRLVNAANKATHRCVALRNTALIAFMADTGLRRGELVSLKVGHITTTKTHYIVAVPGIKSMPRSVPFGDLSDGMMVGEMFTRYFLYIKHELEFTQADPLFVKFDKTSQNLVKKAIHPSSVRELLNSLCKKAGVLHRAPHDFRHFYATYSVLAGMDLPKLQQYLGHRSPGTAMRYVHIADRIRPDLRQFPTAGLRIPVEQRGYAALQRAVLKQSNKP
jgi:integrase/recombinase XerD